MRKIVRLGEEKEWEVKGRKENHPNHQRDCQPTVFYLTNFTFKKYLAHTTILTFFCIITNCSNAVRFQMETVQPV